MKIPTPNYAPPSADPVNARPIDSTPSNLDFRDGTDVLNRGIGNLASGVEDVAAANRKLVEDAKRKAEAINAANADADLESTITEIGHGNAQGGDKTVPITIGADNSFVSQGGTVADGTPGYFSTRGKEAAATSKDAMDAAVKAQGQIASRNFSDPEMKAKWLAQSRNRIEAFHLHVEAHVSTQRDVAAADAATGLAAAQLQAANNNPFDEAGAASGVQRMKEKIDALAKSPEGAARDLAEYRSKLTQVRLNSLLDAKRYEQAKQLFNDSSGDLGPNVDRGNILRAIDAGIGMGQAEHTATGMVREATAVDGRVDEAKALDLVEKVPEGPMRDEVRRRVEAQVGARMKAYSEQTDLISKQAFAAYNTGGWPGIAASLRVDLNNRNPALYDRLKTDAERKFKEQQGSKADAKKAQADRNREALNDFMALPTADRAEQDLDLFLAGRGVDAVGASALGPAKRRAGEDVTKGQAERTDAFVADSMAAAQGTVKSKNDQAAFKASALQTYNDFVEKEKRPPSKTEAQALISGQLLDVTKTKPRFGDSIGFIGPGEETGWQQLARKRKAPAVAGKTAALDFGEGLDLRTPASYAYSPDRKQRRPRFADGTLGPAEQVP